MTLQRAKPAGWAPNERLTSAQLNALDVNQSQAIDGSAGGTYSPTAPIVIGGAGINPTLKATTWPNFAADVNGVRTFTRSHGLAVARLMNGSIIPPGFLVGQAQGTVASCVLPTVDGSTLTGVTLRFALTGHSSLPLVGPGVAVVRLVPRANTWVSLNSGDPPLPALPIINIFPSAALTLPIPITVGAYNASTTLTYLPNQNNVVDRSQHVFMLLIFDESGGGAMAGNVFQSVDITFTASDMRVP